MIKAIALKLSDDDNLFSLFSKKHASTTVIQMVNITSVPPIKSIVNIGLPRVTGKPIKLIVPGAFASNE